MREDSSVTNQLDLFLFGAMILFLLFWIKIFVAKVKVVFVNWWEKKKEKNLLYQILEICKERVFNW